MRFRHYSVLSGLFFFLFACSSSPTAPSPKNEEATSPRSLASHVTSYLTLVDQSETAPTALVLKKTDNGIAEIATCEKAAFLSEAAEDRRDLAYDKHCKAEVHFKGQKDFDEFVLRIQNYLLANPDTTERDLLLNLGSGFASYFAGTYSIRAWTYFIDQVNAKKFAKLTSDKPNRHSALIIDQWSGYIGSVYRDERFYVSEEAMLVGKKIVRRGIRLRSTGMLILGSASAYGVFSSAISQLMADEKRENLEATKVVVTTLQDIKEQTGAKFKPLPLITFFRAMRKIGYPTWGLMNGTNSSHP